MAELLAKAFTRPVERLQAIADQLEQSGTLTAGSLRELRQVIQVLTDSPSGLDRHTAVMLSGAAEIFGTGSFKRSVSSLAAAADSLESGSLGRNASAMTEAAGSIADSVEWLRRNRGYFDQ